MAFAWTAVSVGDKFTSGHYNEVQDAVDTLTTALGIAAYAWAIFPVSTGTKIFDLDDTSELRDALDYVYDNNVCVSDNADKDTTVDNDQHSTYNSGTNSPVNSSANSTPK
jgi:hypothetical protein